MREEIRATVIPTWPKAFACRMLPLTLYHSISLCVLLKSLIAGHLNVSFSPTVAVIGKESFCMSAASGS